MDFLKFAISTWSYQLVICIKRIYVKWTMDLGFWIRILDPEHILSYIFALNYYCELLFIKGKW